MPILGYTTSIEVSKTAGEIQKVLARLGVKSVSTMYDNDGVTTGISFTMKTDYGFRDFELPVRAEGVLAAMKKDPKVTRSSVNATQAARVAWRIAKVWLEAQAALIDAQLATLDEVMLPYMLNGAGQTVYSMMRESAMKELDK